MTDFYCGGCDQSTPFPEDLKDGLCAGCRDDGRYRDLKDEHAKLQGEHAFLRQILWDSIHKLEVAAGFIGVTHKNLGTEMQHTARIGRDAIASERQRQA